MDLAFAFSRRAAVGEAGYYELNGEFKVFYSNSWLYLQFFFYFLLKYFSVISLCLLSHFPRL